MRKIGILGIGIGILALLLVAIPVSATTVDECKADIGALRADTLNVTYTNSKDLTTLLSKLDDADQKLDKLKLSDAILKLQNYVSKAVTLIDQGKIASSDGVTPQGLADAGNATIACVENITT